MIKKRIRYLSFFINIDIRKWNTFIAYFNLFLLHVQLKCKQIQMTGHIYQNSEMELPITIRLGEVFPVPRERELKKSDTGCSFIFSFKFFDFSELCQFCCSAGVLPAWCVYTHWHRGKTEPVIFFKNRKKHNI